MGFKINIKKDFMKRKFKIFLILIILLNITNTGILTGQKIDTFALAKELGEQNEYKKSVQLYKSYYYNHPKDLYAGWMFANALFNNTNYHESQEIYSNLIKLFPENLDLGLDYSVKMTDMGEFDKAIYHLSKIKNKLPKDYLFIAEKTLAKIYLWKGDYEKSLTYINKALNIYSNNEEVLKIRKDIKLARSNWLKIDASYFADDQPLVNMKPNIEMGLYHNSKLSSGLKLQLPIFSKDYTNYYGQGLEGLVSYRFLKSKMEVSINGGIFKFPSNEYDFTGGINIRKNLFKYSTIDVNIKRKPYLAINPDDKKLLQNIFGISLERNKLGSWTGKLSYDYYQFPSVDNSYYSASSWLLSPSVQLFGLDIRLGYGLNFSDSKRSNFVPKESIEKILSDFDYLSQIKGVYNPFFSPNKQLVNSAIIAMSYNPFQNLSIGFYVNYGFLAKTNSPYFYINEPDNGELIITQGYFIDKYNPLQINANISYVFSPEITVVVYHNYQSTNYYISNLTGLTSKILF